MDHIHYNGLVPVFRIWGVPKASSPSDDVHPEAPVCSEGFPAVYLMRDPKPLESAGDRMEELLVLVHLRAGSGTDTCVSGVHVSASVALQQGHLTVTCSSTPMKRLPRPTNSVAGMTRSESVGRARRHAVAPAP